MFFSKSLKNIDDKEYLGREEYTILQTPNDPLIKYKGLKFKTQADLFIYKNQNFVNDNMKWIEIQTFKLYYDKKYIQCLYIKNINSVDKTSIILYSQCLQTNIATSLPFLIDLSNYLKINIITYEYNSKLVEQSNYFDANILYNYLYRVEFIKNIILLGLSLGNRINMNIMISKINTNIRSKIKAFIFISPTWIYKLASLKKIKNYNLIKGDVQVFLDEINRLKIPLFIIHGKLDSEVKYFLSLSFSQKINNKVEWFPKNGDHFNIINEHRRKLLIKIKEFLNNNKNTNFDILNQINGEDINKTNTLEGRSTALFSYSTQNKNESEKKNTGHQNDEDDDYYSHYNNNDIMKIKKTDINNNKTQEDNNNTININSDDNDYYTICKIKIKDEDNITVNQNLKEDDVVTLNQNMKDGDDITVNQPIKNNDDVTINQNVKDSGKNTKKNHKYFQSFSNISFDDNDNNNSKNEDKYFDENNDITLNEDMMNNLNVTINQNNIQYEDEDNSTNTIPRKSTVSFIPGDIIPTIKNKNKDPNVSFIYRKPTKKNRNVSFVSFY